jgi:hypothetical protein
MWMKVKVKNKKNETKTMTTIYPEREKLQQLEFVQNNQTL